MSIVSMEEHFGCAIEDITTGDCFLTEVDKPQKLLDEINKFVPGVKILTTSRFTSPLAFLGSSTCSQIATLCLI